MNLARHVVFALVLAAAAWPTFAATDYFWNCTTADGIKYADATQCDKGDTAVRVMKGSPSSPAQPPAVPAAALVPGQSDDPSTRVCPADPSYCTQPNQGVVNGSPREQAIAQFMRRRQCEFLQRFPALCAKHE